MIHSADVKFELCRLSVRERSLAAELAAHGEPNLATYHTLRADRYENAAIEMDASKAASEPPPPQVDSRPYPYARILEEGDAGIRREIAWGVGTLLVCVVLILAVMAAVP